MSGCQGIFSPSVSSSTRDDPFKGALSFGVEIEFILSILPKGIPDPHPTDPRTAKIVPTDDVPEWGLHEPKLYWMGQAQAQVARTLNDEFSVVWHNSANRGDPPQKFNAVSKILYSGGVSVSNWMVTEDTSVFIDPDGGLPYINFGLEIESPAYIYSHQAVREVEDVVSQIRNTYRCRVSTFCGLHVHVGRGLQGYEDSHLRRIVATVWTFEAQIATMISPVRQTNPYMLPWRIHSRLAKWAKSKKQSPLDCLNWIIAQTKQQEIIAALVSTNGERLGCNLKNLSTASDDWSFLDTETKKTIEFRWHQGSMDPEEIHHWIQFCIGLVEFAEDSREDTLWAWCRTCIEKTIDEYPVICMLEAMKLPDQALYYEKKIKEFKEQQENNGSTSRK